MIRRATAGSGKKLSAGTGRQDAVHRVRRRRPRQRGRRRGRRDLVQSGAGLLRRVAAAGAGGRSPTGSSRSCARAWRRCAWAIPLDKAVDIGAIVAPVQLRAHPAAGDAGRGGGRDDVAAVAGPCPPKAASIRRRCSPTCDPASTIAQVEIFGPGAGGDDLPHAGRERWRWRTTRPTGWRRASGARTSISRSTSRRRSRRAWCGSTAPTCSTRPPASAGIARAGSGAKGGREGMWEYLKADWEHDAPERQAARTGATERTEHTRHGGEHDPDELGRSTARRSCSSAGKQARPDGGYSRAIAGPKGRLLGEVGEGNRKDIRNAVEAARKAGPGWARTSGHTAGADSLLRRRESVGARGGVRGARRAMTGAGRRRRGARGARRRSRGCSPTRRGPTSTTARCTARRFAAWRWRCTSRIGVIGMACPAEASAARRSSRSWRRPSRRVTR